VNAAAARAAILAVDGGNSKTDLALVAANGTLLSAVRGPTVSHQAVGLEPGTARLVELASTAAVRAGLDAKRPLAELGVYCLAGADLPEDLRHLGRAIGATGLTRRQEILNDAMGALRAGTERPWGIVLICGQGINAAGIAPDGRSFAFPALGEISGDRGGGRDIGVEALMAAIRARDGRGARTALERAVPAHFGQVQPAALTRALYRERIPMRRLGELVPVVFAAAEGGDAVARSILDAQADELVTMATAVARRLGLVRLDPEVVLAGGVFQNEERVFLERIRTGIGRVVPRARVVRLTAPAVVGAALLGLDRLAGRGGAAAATTSRLRAALEAWRPPTVPG
jgi:N-acetylglucosamine kinase-like BadF-type ATPase